MSKILTHKDYISFKIPIEFEGFRAIGYFPYHTASILSEVRPAIRLFKGIEETLRKNAIMDNKYVVLFEDKEYFGTTNFAINFKDCTAKLGSWEDIVQYGGKPLEY